MKNNFPKIIVRSLLIAMLLAGCSTESSVKRNRSEVAAMMFKERCKGAGERIERTVENVDGIYVLKIRPEKRNLADQYVLDDPYGNDFEGELYIRSFLHGAYTTEFRVPAVLPPGFPPHIAYQYADAIDPIDGKRYRYTGRIEEPGLTNKSYSLGYKRFIMERKLVDSPAPRFGVTYEDISTRADRDYWIAGSSLKVLDLQTNEVIAERVGYFYDAAQGTTEGGRSPWLWATSNACPSFGTPPAFIAQLNQAAVFVEKVLHPRKEN